MTERLSLDFEGVLALLLGWIRRGGVQRQCFLAQERTLRGIRAGSPPRRRDVRRAEEEPRGDAGCRLPCGPARGPAGVVSWTPRRLRRPATSSARTSSSVARSTCRATTPILVLAMRPGAPDDLLDQPMESIDYSRTLSAVLLRLGGWLGAPRHRPHRAATIPFSWRVGRLMCGVEASSR